jgi:hypothetical protein
MVSNSIENKEDRGEQLRETWRQVMSVRRSALQFRSRLARTLPTIEEEVGRDPHLGDVVTTITRAGAHPRLDDGRTEGCLPAARTCSR